MITRLLLLLCCFIVASGVAGQDTLFLTKGGLLVGRVKIQTRLGAEHYVVQRRGLDHVLNRSAVARVGYSSKPFSDRYIPRPVFVRRSDKNIFTVNVPSYCYVGTYPGVSVGLEYQRFLDSSGKFSVGLGAHYYWAGTASWGKVYRESRANIKGYFFEPSFLYHPAGNAGFVDPSIGVSLLLGKLHRTDVSDVGKTYPLYTDDGSHLYAAALLQGELCFHNYRQFVFTLYGSCGAMLPTGATGGLCGQIGFKIGGRF